MTASPPSVPTYSTDDYAQALANLLPRGPIWRRDPGSNMMALMGALAPTYERSGAAAAQLVFDIFPATTTDLLVEWEETLGLPDPCTPLGSTVQQRRAAVLAKFIGSGGQSIPYFISVAAALGYPITITELATPYHWQINAPSVTVSYFELGFGVCGDYFWTVDNTELECRIRQIMPAHTVLTFNYNGGLLSDGGVLILTGPTAGFPTSMSGLPVGAFWSNGGVVSVVPGAVPDPTAAAVFFNSSSTASLLALTGANLPVTAPLAGRGQLWNSGGEVWIS